MRTYLRTYARPRTGADGFRFLRIPASGIDVVVMERHADFFRDFRGDTVHPSTLRLLDELGLGERFAHLHHRQLRELRMEIAGTEVIVGDFTRMPGKFPPYMAMVPQWDFLDLLADEAAKEARFTLMRSTDVTGLLRDHDGRVTGVRYQDADGNPGELCADLTAGCDGRGSVVRREAGMSVREFDVPMDVWQVRVPKGPGHDGDGLTYVHFGNGRCAVTVDRGDYYQTVYEIPKGSDAELRAKPIESLRNELAEIFGWEATTLSGIRSWDDVPLLETSMSRLHRWYADGVLCIGDAAHVMSPVGGIGVDLAVQDAVATATLLIEPLRRGKVTVKDLTKVQRRREFPVRVAQRMQLQGHEMLQRPALERRLHRVPVQLRALRWLPPLRGLATYMTGVGMRPERAPAFARR